MNHLPPEEEVARAAAANPSLPSSVRAELVTASLG